MPLFNWSSSYHVGISEIDTQHKKLVDLINEMHDAMKIGQASQKTAPVLDELIKYTKMHFSAEEKILKTNGYAKFDEHKKEHDKLTAQVLQLQSDLKSGKLAINLEVMNFLKDWLQSHILKEDKAYAPHLQSKGIK